MKARYEVQDEFQKAYAETVKTMKEEITTKQTVPLTEEISDEIRQWFRDYHTRTGKLPEFPSEDNGGSRNLLSRQGINLVKCLNTLNNQVFVTVL